MTSTPVRPAGRLRRWRPVLGLIREALWLRAALAVVAFSLACVFLGRWQYHRHEARVGLADRVAANYDAAPVPLATLLGSADAPLPLRDEWRPVQVTGRYEPAGTVLVRNRPLDGDSGFEVLVPLRTASGAALLVDRGWVPFGENADATVRVPAPPAGEVELVARLRLSEPPRGGRPPPGQALRITVPSIAAELGGPVYRGYAVLSRETPAAPTRPRPLDRPNTDLGPHLAYAIQWWSFALAGYVLLIVYGSKEIERRQAGADRPAAPAARRSTRPTRPRGRDEQAEDAQIDRALQARNQSSGQVSAPVSAHAPGSAAPHRSDR
jgi:cytochrome oxidase assembly protein ShyY1